MERLFIIDTENIGGTQYEGLSQLSKKDKVVFIMSKNSQGLQGLVMNEIINCKAIKESILVDVGAKNALDFQLIAYLSMQIQKNRKCNKYYIISKDKGYDAVVNFLNQQSKAEIARITSFNINSSSLKNEYIENPSSSSTSDNVICLDTSLKKGVSTIPLDSNNKSNTQNKNILLEDFLQKEVKMYSKKTLKKIADIASRTHNNNELDEEMFKVFNNHQIYKNCRKAINKYNSLIC